MTADALVTHGDALGDALGAGRSLRLKDGWRRTAWTDRAALVAFALMVLVAVFAPLVAPHSPVAPAGAPFVGPSGGALFGTDGAGRDMLSRVVYGLQYSLEGAFVVVLSGVLIGGVVGLVAGLAGGWVDTLLMRVTDLFLALPAPLLAIAVIAAVGPSFANTLLAVAIVWWPLYARVLRGEVVALKNRPHVAAAKLGRLSRGRLTRRHIIPGLVPSLLVLTSLDIGGLVLTLAGLSFLGLGAPAPRPELGAMAAQGLPYLLSNWWVAVIPSLAILALAAIANLTGDAVRTLTAAPVR